MRMMIGSDQWEWMWIGRRCRDQNKQASKWLSFWSMGIEANSKEFYGACSLGGAISCGWTHTLVTPLDLVKCRRQVCLLSFSLEIGWSDVKSKCLCDRWIRKCTPQWWMDGRHFGSWMEHAELYWDGLLLWLDILCKEPASLDSMSTLRIIIPS